MNGMLEIDDLAMGYGGITAVRGVSLSAAAGQIVGIIGPNGAGKTSLINTISGLFKPKSGRVRFDGTDISGLPAHWVARLGVIQVPEGRQVLGPMTVEENLELGRQAAVGRASGVLDHIYALFPILAQRRRQLAGSLSGGEQQMLAIGRALMGAPRVLMLDEPSLGLSPLMATQVFDALVNLNRGGLTILIVEQNARRALAATTYAYVIERGTIVQHGASAALASDPEIIAHYLGTR
jgi:branched-chain amino acid transport system ATP-binding protein